MGRYTELEEKQKKEIEQLKKELNINKQNFAEIQNIMIPKVSKRIYKLEDEKRQLEKEKKWLQYKVLEASQKQHIGLSYQDKIILLNDDMKQALKDI